MYKTASPTNDCSSSIEVLVPRRAKATTLTFLMAGCQRCGTSWVDAALREHPQIYLPAKKQTYFFDGHYDNGIDWYLSNFEGVDSDHIAVGEVATGYCLPHAVPRVAKHLPHIKLIMTMRNPAERAYSCYLSSQSERSWTSFEEYIANRPDILERGHYAEQVEALLSHYDRSRLLLLFFDDLVRDDRAYLRRIHHFLEVDENRECSQLGTIRNSTTLPRLRYVINRAGLRPLMRRMSGSRIGNVFRRAKKFWTANRHRRMDAAIRTPLIEYYRSWNDRLSALTGRDLSHWNQ